MSLHEKAREALEAVDGDPIRAADALVKMAKADRELRDGLLELGAAQIVRTCVSHNRRGYTPAAPREVPEAAAPLLRRGISERVRQALFMEQRTLFGGAMRLADATKTHLANSARCYDAQIKGLAASAAFERDIGGRLPAGKRVRDVMTDEKVKEIARKHGVLGSARRQAA